MRFFLDNTARRLFRSQRRVKEDRDAAQAKKGGNRPARYHVDSLSLYIGKTKIVDSENYNL